VRPDMSGPYNEECGLCSVIEKCWKQDPSERPGLCELKEMIMKKEKKQRKNEKKERRDNKDGRRGR
jgi:hypothetical protein